MSSELPKIAHDILRYTSENPKAADTLEGIAEWWLPDKYPLTQIRRVLARLAEDGLMDELEGRYSRTLYRMKQVG